VEGFAGGEGVEGVLQEAVEVAHAVVAFLHGGEHLDLVGGVAEAGGDFLGDEFDDEGGDGFFGLAKEEEVFGVVVEEGHLAAVDAVGVGDDLAALRLAEDVGQAGDGYDGGLDEVGEYGAGADAGELVYVADEDEVGAGGDGVEEFVDEGEVDHAHFVDDDDVGLEVLGGGGFVVFAGEAEEAVDGLGGAVGGFGEAFGGATGGGGEGVGFVQAVEDADDFVDEEGFAAAGATGDDADGAGEGNDDGLGLFGVEAGVGVDGLQVEAGQAGVGGGEQAADAGGDGGFGAVVGFEVADFLPGEGVEDEF